ncbi:hypothetical protein C7B65_22770 [Phormidesmis priestleyi ULC007]|uniref:Uncharacterized protein n=1 Tax=Phormidesmis priestleyi ULC007 TaxID=1920490 RepID=A0A2T1D6J8_9CYAN|nr:hypothetical protein [Phormidesmis priestleyi]PSB16051.1 hypothetical protein C7B65_22770 [Phormidesmis priestleyi ULC007]PZO52247.1 MAG: hypothetical protein DCF14_07220 [Phormidesmis priestleyi]
MPRQRFSAVLRGYRGQAARDKFIQHLQGLGTQGDNIGTKGNRPPSIDLYIEPFALPLGTNTLVKVSALRPSWDLLKGGSEVSSRVKTVLSGSEVSIKLSRYSAARVVRRQTTGTTGTAKTSKLTGLKYLHYNTETASVPFGKKTGDLGAFAVFQEISTQNEGSSTNLKYTFIDENV